MHVRWRNIKETRPTFAKTPSEPITHPKRGGGFPFSVISLIVTSIPLYCNVPPTPDGEQLGGRDSVFYFDIASAQYGA